MPAHVMIIEMEESKMRLKPSFLAHTVGLGLLVGLLADASVALAQATAPAAAPAPGGASDADTARAAALFEQGRESFVAGNLVDACPKLAESYRLDPATGTLMALARCHEQEGKVALAWAELEEALQRARQEGRVDREKYVKERMEVLRPRVFTAPEGAKSEPATTPAAAPVAIDPVFDSGAAQPASSEPSAEAVMATRIGAFVVLGLGGESEVDAEGPGTPFESDMLTTFGLGVQFEFPVHKLFVLGGGPIISFVNDESNDDADYGRSILLDASVYPKVRYPFGSGSTTAEVYAAVPVGLSVMFLNGDITDAADDVGADISTPFGFNLGFMAGAQVSFAEGWGLFGQLGYKYHSVAYTIEAPGFTDTDLDLTYGQFQLNAGAVWSL